MAAWSNSSNHSTIQPFNNSYLSLATANNRFDGFKIRPKRVRWAGKTFLAILLIFAILLNYVSFFVPSAVQAAAPDPTIEQQINIIDQEYQCTLGLCFDNAYHPGDSSLGLIKWDGTKYSGEAVFFEAIIKLDFASVGITAQAALFTDGDTATPIGAVETPNQTYTRVRSNDISGSLSDDTDYTVNVKSAGGERVITIKAARLIIVQTDATSITATQTQVEVGNNETTTGTSYADLTDKKIYRYTAGNFSPTPTVNFEASLKSSSGEGTPTDTGPNNPATGAEGTTIGETSWESYTDSFSNNATYDGVSLDKGIISYYNKATNFSFSGIPTDATIKGIKVEINGYVSNTFMDDYSVRIVKGGTVTGTSQADSATDWPTSDDGTYRTYGGATNLWGTTWLPSDINSASGFGVAFAFKNNKTGQGATYTGYIDHIRITVTYAPAIVGTAYAALYTTGGSEVCALAGVNSTSWTLQRTASSCTLSDGMDYVVRIKSSSGGTTTFIANAKIILDQTAAGGITALETVQQYNNTLAETNSTSYISQDFDNEFNKANFAGGTFVALFETTIKTGLSSDAYFAQLDTPLGEQTGTDTTYTRKTSGDLWISLPASATDIDIQLKIGGAGGGPLTSSSTSWLVIKVSSLQVPEYLLIFIPVAIFIPAIMRWFRKRKQLGYNIEWRAY